MLQELKDDRELSDISPNPYKKAVVPLANGLLKIYEPSLLQIQSALNELREKETLLIDQVHDENLALTKSQFSDELNSMFAKMELYQTKLAHIKKDMKYLHEKSVKLKKRALKIRQFREKQEYIKQQKEAEIKMEQSLIPNQKT